MKFFGSVASAAVFFSSNQSKTENFLTINSNLSKIQPTFFF